jgi:hypothetical protein
MDRKIDQYLRHIEYHIDLHKTFLEKLDIALKVAQAKIEDLQEEVTKTSSTDQQKLKDLTNEMIFQDRLAMRLSKVIQNNSRRSS